MVQVYTPTVSLAASSNIYYVPLDGDIEAYAASADDGDTLILAGGTYSVSDDIDITKAISLVGQGREQTVITCSGANINVIDISHNDVTLSNLKVEVTGGVLTKAIRATGSVTGLTFMDIDVSSASSDDGINLTASVDIINPNFSTVRVAPPAATINKDTLMVGGGTVNIYGGKISNVEGNSVSCLAATNAGTVVNSYGTSYICTHAATDRGVRAYSSAVINLYGGYAQGSAMAADLSSYSLSAINVYGCVLYCGSTDILTGGSINYLGTTVGANYKSSGYWYNSSQSAITASTTQTQGQGPLTKELNEVSICANANDTVTLPSSAPGMQITVTASGVNTVQIFPALGDRIDALALNASTTLATGKSKSFTSYNSTNWVSEALN